MSNIIKIFYEITAIPRCSKNFEPFINYMKQKANEYGYECHIDKVNNILCKKEDSKATLCLQSHYDIVCLEEGKIPEIIEEDGFLRAKDSTLGADNGMGCAIMLSLMSEGKDCEYLFTSDEEIGLIGANDIEFTLDSKYMLNLDSEAEDEVCIGCAGGVDIFATNSTKQIISNDENYTLYECEIKNLDGGHSGVDIDKEIPNAIKLVAKTIKEADAKILDINGGERINSIPKSCKAIIASKTTPLASHENMSIEKIDTESKHLNIYSDDISNLLYTFANGVRGYDISLGVVLDSINLAQIETTIDSIKINFSARSMQNDRLESLKNETTTLLHTFGFETTTDGKYPAWKPDINEFTQEVLKTYQRHNPEASLEAIHAGLECAIFKDKFPHIKVASIGPNIYNPHSFKERCEIQSVENIYKIVLDIVDKY